MNQLGKTLVISVLLFALKNCPLDESCVYPLKKFRNNGVYFTPSECNLASPLFSLNEVEQTIFLSTKKSNQPHLKRTGALDQTITHHADCGINAFKIFWNG